MRKDPKTIFLRRFEARRLKQSGLTYEQLSKKLGCTYEHAAHLCHKGASGRWGDNYFCTRCGKKSEVFRHTQNYLNCRYILVCKHCHTQIHQNIKKRKDYKRHIIHTYKIPKGWRIVRRGWHIKSGDKYWCNSVEIGRCWLPVIFTGWKNGCQYLYGVHKERPLVFIRRSDKITAAKP